jgi:hypothetical protein
MGIARRLVIGTGGVSSACPSRFERLTHIIISPRLCRIRAKISVSFSDSCVCVAAHGDVAAAQGRCVAAGRASVEGRWLGKALQRAGAATARRRGG